MSKEKLSISRKEQQLINVEKLLACIAILDDKAKHISLEWYPKNLHGAISKFMYNDIHEIIKALVMWIEANVEEEYYD